MVGHAYIHIPFCIRKCKYCSFVSGEDINRKSVYINALLKEIKSKYRKEKLKTLYLGGGTPSLLSAADIKKIMNLFEYEVNPEITIEVNPETVNEKKFKEYKSLGINRISLGVQTFNNAILKKIGRGHSEKQTIDAVETIKKTGFRNISIDLIYGLPEQSLNDWEIDLKKARNLNVNHISAYGLKIEQDSFFYNNPPNNLPDDDIQAQMYNVLCDFLHDFNHYEISNFALYGFESVHNCTYWLNKEYYGFGLNASGYEKNIRYKNTSKFNEYIKNPLTKEEFNELTVQETMENEIFLALRLKSGLNIGMFNEKYNVDFLSIYGKIIEKYEKSGLLKKHNNIIQLTRCGILLSNEIMAAFIN